MQKINNLHESTEGYQFVGLVLDQRTQPFPTEDRIKTWLSEITPQLLPDTAL